jgi:hypothetical protein
MFYSWHNFISFICGSAWSFVGFLLVVALLVGGIIYFLRRLC